MKLFIVILLATTILAQNSPDFQQNLQTGSKDVSSMGTHQIPFSNPSAASNYEYALSMEHLVIKYQNNDTNQDSFSIQIKVTSPLQQDKITIIISSNFPSKIKAINVRYLIVFPAFPYIKVAHFETDLLLQTNPVDLSSSNNLVSTLPLAQSLNTTSKLLPFLTGFEIIANSWKSIYFLSNVTFSNNNSLTVNFTNYQDNSKPNKIYFLSLDIIIFDHQAMGADYDYAFDNDVSMNYNKSWNYFHNNQTIDSSLVFYGLTGLYYDYQDRFSCPLTCPPVPPKDLNFTFSINDKDLIIEKQFYGHIQISYIVLSISINCNSTSTWTPAKNKCEQCLTFQHYINSTKQCDLCPSHCTLCKDSGGQAQCTDCEPFYLVDNKSCIYNCSLIDLNCKTCSQVKCLTCQSYLALSSDKMKCIPICGDGIVLSQQQCDDGNTNDRDGCSSQCTIEQNFDCSRANSSTCWLTWFSMEPLCTIKDPEDNIITITFQIYPLGPIFYETVGWTNLFNSSLPDLEPTNANLDSSSGKLRVSLRYGQSFTYNNAKIVAKVSVLALQFQNITDIDLYLPENIENNLSIQYFSEFTYSLAKAVKYISFVLSGIALLLFVVGNLGSKLIALQCIAVFQLVALLQFGQQKMIATFDSLFPLSLSLGIIKLSFPSYRYESSDLPYWIKAQVNTQNLIHSINYFLLVIVLPILTGVVAKIISAKCLPENKVVEKIWKNCLGTYTYYGLLFLAYGQFSQLAVNSRYYGHSIEILASIGGGALFAVILIIYVIFSYKHHRQFGSFRNKIEMYNISEHYYSIEAIDRAITPFLIIFMTPNMYTPIFASIIFGIQLLFVVVGRPYRLNDWKRPCLNKIICLIFCLTYFGVNFWGETSLVAMYGPLLILSLLFLILLIAIKMSIPQIKSKLQDLKSKLQPLMSTQECNKLITAEFQGKIMKDVKSPYNKYSLQFNSISLMRQKQNWQNYTKLYSISLADIQKAQKRKIVHQKSIIQELAEEEIKCEEQNLKSPSQI